jgi:hypothetical protein
MAKRGRVVTEQVSWRQSKLVFAMAMAVGMFAIQAGPSMAAEDGAAGESPSPKSLWINPGLYSYHYDNKHLNNENWGIGVEYRYSDTVSVTAGEYKNSANETSHYLSCYWQPFAIGPVKLGATIGAIDGYSNYKDGAWFLAAIPAATYEGKRFGLNVLLVPNYKDTLDGAISFQVKFRVW